MRVGLYWFVVLDVSRGRLVLVDFYSVPSPTEWACDLSPGQQELVQSKIQNVRQFAVNTVVE